MSPKSHTEGVDWHARFLQQARWTRDLREYLFERVHLVQAKHILEVGCGTGAILQDLHPSGKIWGLDLDFERLGEAHLHAPGAILLCADGKRLPFTPGTFDLSFCHFLLLWVKDPLQVLAEMRRVTRAGGYVLALAEPDYTARVDAPESLAPLGKWQTKALRNQGAEPSIGGQLALLFRRAGIRTIETGKLEESPRRRPAREERELEWKVLEADLAGAMPAEELRRMKRLDEQAWRRGERRLSVPTYFAWGQVPGMV